jgi:hypothetical protein
MRIISELDDYPIHQDAKPLRQPASTHRDFDDATYFFVCDRAGRVAAFVTLECFPNRNLLRSAVFLRVGERHLRSIWFDKLEAAPGRATACGENRFTIEEPHRRWRIELRDPEIGLKADLVWTPRCPSYHFGHVFLEREGGVAIDMEHYTTSSLYQGALEVAGERFEGLWGHRCRSWGVRDWAKLPFYTWLNAQFDDRCVNLWLQEDRDGGALYCDGAVTTPAGEVLPIERFEHEILELHPPHEKRAKRRSFTVWLKNGERFEMSGEEIGSLILAPLPDDWRESDAEAMDEAQRAALWYEQHTRFRIGDREGYGFVENLVAPGSRRRGIPSTPFPDLDPGAFDDDD